MTREGAIDGNAFKVSVREVLVPTHTPSQVVIRDTRSVHKRISIRASIEAANCHLVLLPA
jgi:hypothetical protein